VLYALIGVFAIWRVVDELATPDDLRWSSVVFALFWTLALAAYAVQFLSADSWRRVPLAPEERRLWGTAAAQVLPTGGAGHEGTFVLTDRELRFLPGVVARLRGTSTGSWPIGSLAAVRVTPVDERRRRRGGRWVTVDLDGGGAVTILTPEPHLVADELFDALHARGLLPRTA